MLYSEELQKRLPKYARERTPGANYYGILPTLQIDMIRAIFQRDANAFSTKPPAKKGGAEDKGGKVGKVKMKRE